MEKNTPFWDSALPIEKRLDWLMAEMTIEEKLGCLSSGMKPIERLGIPAMSLGGEAAHGVEARNDQNDINVPEPTTSFVQPIGMSAAWDPELIRQAGTVTGTETRVIYHRHPDRGLSRWAPTVDLERDPRWGRTEEGYGEDPYLTGEMASAYVQGMQGEDPRHLRVAATLKHFYGNNTEAGRGWKNASIDPRNQYELYLEPFRRVIEKGHAEAVMTAYNAINGIPGMLNPQVRHVLKEEYGLKHAVCDGGAMALLTALHHYYGTDAEAIAGAVKAGVDAMSDNPAMVEKAAREAWELGLLTEDEIDEALRNTFRTRLRLGIYDGEPGCTGNIYDRVTEDDLDSEENRAVCRQVSREAVVLLKNQGGMLPLAPEKMESVAVAGPLGNAWYPDWYGGTPVFTRTLLEGMQEAAGRIFSFEDGLDQVVFRLGGKGIAVAEDGTLCISDEPDVFLHEDWGEGSHTFRCVRTGKYMNTRLYQKPGTPESKEAPGRIAAEKDNTLNWFVMEIFHVEEKEDGAVILTNRFGSPVQVCEDGQLWSMRLGEGTAFRMEVVKDGRTAAVELAKKAGTVILALGCNSMINAKEEVDRGTIELPPAQRRLMEAVYEANPNVVLVLFSNYPYAIGWAQEKFPAILWSATGAQDMGTAMAETLLGYNNPAGRLSMTWYQSDEQLPDIEDYDIIGGGRTYRYFEGEVLYPFGHGLSYTQFAYSDLQVKAADGSLKVTFRVENTGNCVGDEVAQVYGVAPASRVKKPLRQLIGFERLKGMKPGESRLVELTVDREEFRFYDVISGKLMVEEGRYRVFAGPSSAVEAVSAWVDLPGERTGKRDTARKIAADHYDGYENIVLTEGHFGFTAAAVKDAVVKDAVVNGAAVKDAAINGVVVKDAAVNGVAVKDAAVKDVFGKNASGKGTLCYRDCLIDREASEIVLHLKSEKGCSVKVFLDGCQAACWEGDTATYERMGMPPMDEKSRKEAEERRAGWKPIYADVRLPLEKSALEGKDGKAVEIRIELTGDVRLCYFRVEKNSQGFRAM